MVRNQAFFRLYENLFLVLKTELGEEKALEIFTKIMAKGLKEAYDKYGFEQGNLESFCNLLKARDESVGLAVELKIIDQNSIEYTFYEDPFPGLKGQVRMEDLDKTYLQFKIDYILGTDWKYKTISHFWLGGNCNKYLIYKS